MKFQLIDTVLERDENRLVALKQVSLAEEYLGDHFPGFPVLPGVMMLEAMVQAARELVRPRTNRRLVLGSVKALKYGAMVRPGEALEIEVELKREDEEGLYEFRGTGRVRRLGVPGPGSGGGSEPIEVADGETAVSGRFTMRDVRPA